MGRHQEPSFVHGLGSSRQVLSQTKGLRGSGQGVGAAEQSRARGTMNPIPPRQHPCDACTPTDVGKRRKEQRWKGNGQRGQEGGCGEKLLRESESESNGEREREGGREMGLKGRKWGEEKPELSGAARVGVEEPPSSVSVAPTTS